MNQKIITKQELIGSAEAARISGYSTEYIARLCRRGEVEARRVGRSWYVVASSLSAHLARRSGETHEGGLVAKDFLPADLAGKQVGYTGDYVSKLCREGSIACNKVGRVWHAEIESLEQFTKVQSVKIEEKKNTLTEARRKEYQSKERSRKLFDVVTGKSLMSFVATQGVAGTAVIALFILGTFFVSGRLQYHPLVVSVAEAISLMPVFVYEAVRVSGTHVATTLVATTDSFSETKGETTSDTNAPKELGMVVVPKSEKENIEEIKNSFSDEVLVSRIDSTTGVIEPVFKNSEGGEYLYLMVPVDDRDDNDEPKKEAP